MKTETIKVTYSLTDEVYRANVREASGPTPRVLEVEIPVGELTPEGRLALLEIPIPSGPFYCPAAESAEYLLTWGTPIAAAPTAEDVSAELVRRAEKVKAEKAAKENAERERAEAAHAAHAARVAELTGLLNVLDVEFAEVHDAKAARKAAVKLPGEYGSPNELTDRIRAFWKRVAEAEKREAEKDEEKLRAWVQRVAAEHEPELARAAREGRKLGSRPRKLLEAILTARIKGIVFDGEDVTVLDNWNGPPEEREGVPTARAYEVFDALTAAKDKLGEDLPFPITIEPISRVELRQSGESAYVTCVPVFIDYGDASVVVLCEPMPEFSPEEEEDY